MDVIIPTNLVCVLFDPAIPTSSFNYIVFYACFYNNINVYQKIKSIAICDYNNIFWSVSQAGVQALIMHSFLINGHIIILLF